MWRQMASFRCEMTIVGHGGGGPAGGDCPPLSRVGQSEMGRPAPPAAAGILVQSWEGGSLLLKTTAPGDAVRWQWSPF